MQFGDVKLASLVGAKNLLFAAVTVCCAIVIGNSARTNVRQDLLVFDARQESDRPLCVWRGEGASYGFVMRRPYGPQGHSSDVCMIDSEMRLRYQYAELIRAASWETHGIRLIQILPFASWVLLIWLVPALAIYFRMIRVCDVRIGALLAAFAFTTSILPVAALSIFGVVCLDWILRSRLAIDGLLYPPILRELLMLIPACAGTLIWSGLIRADGSCRLVSSTFSRIVLCFILAGVVPSLAFLWIADLVGLEPLWVGERFAVYAQEI